MWYTKTMNHRAVTQYKLLRSVPPDSWTIDSRATCLKWAFWSHGLFNTGFTVLTLCVAVFFYIPDSSFLVYDTICYHLQLMKSPVWQLFSCHLWCQKWHYCEKLCPWKMTYIYIVGCGLHWDVMISNSNWLCKLHCICYTQYLLCASITFIQQVTPSF